MSFPLISILLFAAAPLSAQGAFLGVELASSSLEIEGAVIAGVESPSAASIMGLLPDDVVFQLDDSEIYSNEALLAALAGRLPGEIATLTVLRGGAEVEILGVLGRRPGDSSAFHPRPELPPSGFAWPSMPNFDWPAMPEMPDLRIPNLKMPKMPEIEWPEMPDFESLFGAKGPGFHFQQVPGGLDGAKVRVTWPANTPESNRERLIEEAREDYGEGVEVEFIGSGHSISIHQSRSSGHRKPEKKEEEDI